MQIVAHQLSMAPSVEANLRQVVAGLRSERADVHLFPECALTGFHRALPDQVDSPELSASQAQLQALVNAEDCALVVGAPLRTEGGVLNGLLCLAPHASAQWVAKRGLTPSEQRFFSPPCPGGLGWERVVRLKGRRLGLLLCREVLDPLPDLSGAEALLWPGYIQWDGQDDYRQAAEGHCRRLGVPLLQANWADSLNAPGTRGMGGSLVLGTKGRLQDRAPLDQSARLRLSLTG